MSFAFVVMMALLCSSVAIAFVLQPPKEDAAAPPDSNSRCHGGSLQSIRKGLLAALNLQVEPRLPEGAIAQWSSIAERMKALPISSSDSVSADDGKNSGCCTVTSEVLMRELGWDKWMIYPDRVTVVQCAPCSPHMPCHPPQPDAQGADSQVPPSCCQPTSYEDVPVCYRDEFDSVVITSMHLPRRCGCPSAA
ncbi:gonadal somatic cell derived factor [Dunckerocampus dactyliophorus]|uniref:gonadal somatic cell derived factor n=1 Tax=Dunckerocampus dactyliophorus TaxID=161453 RepID=UPI00240631F9|nr:gonadal somatic cell derived factor [Dunckerocampus dactyliophorus]